MDVQQIDTSGMSRQERYTWLRDSAAALFQGERNAVANAANLSALIWHSLPDLNWAGFYFLDGAELVLGPFQGKVACVRIGMGRGVCGTAAVQRKTQVVTDVDQFPGHIACDAASRSELVVPLLSGERLLGVLDLDSPKVGRFEAQDAAELEQLARLWVEASDHPPV
jgi:GAF domain-containing protein